MESVSTYETRPKVCRVKESAPRWLPLRVTYWITERICWLAQKTLPKPRVS